MRYVLGTTALLFVTLVSLPAFATSVEEVPNPRHQGGWVSDTIDVIPANAGIQDI